MAKSLFFLSLFFVSYSFAHPGGNTLYVEINAQEKQEDGYPYEVKLYFPEAVPEEIYEAKKEYQNRSVISVLLPNVVKKIDETTLYDATIKTDGGKTFNIRDWGFSKLVISRYFLSEPIEGKNIEVNYPDDAYLVVLIKLSDADGNAQTLFPSENEHSLLAPEQKTPAPKIIVNFIKSGVMHILEGFDHLLFIFSLTLIAGRRYGALFWTVTGFTLSHSVTLILTSLGVISFHPPLVELGIALSILYLLAEILLKDKLRDVKPSFTYRFPVIVSTSFGLLHGMGFAGALKEVGLPKEGLIPALLSFNVGVELGQLFFVAVLYGVLGLFSLPNGLRVFLKENSFFARRIVGVLAFCLTLFWTYERALALF